MPPADGPDGPVIPKTFATTTTGALGEFSLDGVPSGLARQHNGSVELMVTGSSGDQAVHYSLLAEPPTDSRPTWSQQGSTDALPELRLQFGLGEVSDPTATTLTASSGSQETAPPTYADPDDTDDELLDSIPISTGTSTCTAGYGYIWAPLDKYRRRHPPIQRLTTKNHSSMQYVWETSEETQLEAAFTGDGGKYAGGLMYSKMNDTSTGMDWTKGNNVSQILRVEWQYRKYQKTCYADPWDQATYTLNVFTWRPNKITTGSRSEDNNPSWACDADTTVYMDAKTWVVRTSRVKWSGFFSIAKIRLAAHQTNTSQDKLTVIPDTWHAGNSEPSARVCGDNDFPLYANRTKERVR